MFKASGNLIQVNTLYVNCIFIKYNNDCYIEYFFFTPYRQYIGHITTNINSMYARFKKSVDNYYTNLFQTHKKVMKVCLHTPLQL